MSNVQTNTPSESAALENTDDAADAILSRWNEDGESLSEDNDLEATDGTEEDTDTSSEEPTDTDEPEQEASEQDDEDLVENEEPETKEEAESVVEVTDDTQVEIVVDGKSEQASIKDLKRLYGQEASLTRKSQELSSQRKLAEERIQKADASFRVMMERAEAKYKPYSEIDMLVESRRMDPEEFAQLRVEAKEASDELKYLTEEADNFYNEIQKQQDQQLAVQAKECIEVLKTDISDWSDDLYNDIRNYAVSSGLPKDQVDRYADPSVIKLINKARLYDQSKKTAVAKKAKAPAKVLRSKKAPPNPTSNRAEANKKSLDILRSNPNDRDAIAEALMARWEE
jgi:translation elongation factor P/translation initiation factor 5A